MSHHIKVDTRVTNKTTLVAALKRLDLPVASVTDTKVTMEERLYFMKESGNWNLEGDPWYCKNRTLKSFYQREDELVRQVNVAYATEEAMMNAHLQGLTLVDQQENEQQLVLTFEG